METLCASSTFEISFESLDVFLGYRYLALVAFDFELEQYRFQRHQHLPLELHNQQRPLQFISHPLAVY